MVAAAALVTAASPSLAQKTEAAADPARLVAARALVDQLLPPDRRETMIEELTKSSLAVARDAIVQSPELKRINGGDPRAADLLARFMDSYLAESMAITRRTVPKLMDAMASAYARLFSVAQLDEIRAFYSTPTGRTFMDKQASVLADPAVVAVQQEIAAAELAGLPELAAKLKEEMAKLPGDKP